MGSHEFGSRPVPSRLHPPSIRTTILACRAAAVSGSRHLSRIDVGNEILEMLDLERKAAGWVDRKVADQKEEIEGLSMVSGQSNSLRRMNSVKASA